MKQAATGGNMGKPYNRKKVQQQAFIGWLIIAAGFAIQLLLESFLWNESRPDMASYLIGIPFAIGGIIFLHALLTFMTGTEHHPLHHKDEDVSDTYQANMVQIRRHFKVCALVFLVGGGLFATFFITKIAFFSVGFFILFVGVLTCTKLIPSIKSLFKFLVYEVGKSLFKH